MTVLSSSSPYAWPWDGHLDPSRLALLVISSLPTSSHLDQSPTGSGVVTSGLAAPSGAASREAQATEALAGVVRETGGIVVNLMCQTDGQPTPEGWMAAPQIDGFYESRLDSYLRAQGRDQLLLAGTWLETTVHSTLRSANDRGYECLIVQDLCVSYDPDLRTGSLSCIEMSGGIFGAIDSSTHVTALLTTHFSH